MLRQRSHWPIGALLGVFIILAGIYSVVNPLFEAPDEVWHYEYVRWLTEGHGLPRPEQVGDAPWHQEGSQPPLYYLLPALITAPIPTDNAADVIRYNPHVAMGQPDSAGNKNVLAHGAADAWPWRGVALAGHLVRFFSILLGAVTLACTYACARVVFPDRREVALLAAALVAFNPQFVFLSAAVNNDNLVIACSAAGIWLLLRLLDRRALVGPTTRQLILLGVILGAAALSKLSGLLLSGMAALALITIAWQRRSLRGLVRWGLIGGAAALAVGGWWYVRNLILYGDPLGLQAMFDILPRRAAPPTTAELLGRVEGIWRSAWAVFGTFNIVPDEWIYHIYTGLSLLGVAGLTLVAPLRRRFARNRVVGSHNRWPQMALLIAWLLIVLLALIQWAQMRYPQGRLLFPAISAAGILLAAGLLAWVPTRARAIVAGFLSAGLFVLAAVAPWLWIASAFAVPKPLPLTVELPNPTSVDYGSQVRLVGYHVGEESLRPGDTLAVELFWQALGAIASDYSVFVHLTDEFGILQAQRDSYPASGNYPTREWPAGVIVPDAHPVWIPDTAPAPASLRIDVGLYDYDSGARLPAGAGDSWTIGYVTLLPRGDEIGLPNPVFINFADQIALVGFEFDRRAMHPGETLGLTFHWQALQQPRADYVVFSHLVYPPDAVWAQMDEMPAGGPTGPWAAGQLVEDHHQLALPLDAPAGVYYVEIGIYDPVSMDRLFVNLSDRGVVLGQVAVAD